MEAARLPHGCRHVALKIYVTSNEMGEMQDVELDAYMCIENSSINHPGRRAIRLLRDSFDIDGPDGRHRCLVHLPLPLWDSVYGFRHRNPIQRLPTPVMAFVLQRLFLTWASIFSSVAIRNSRRIEAGLILLK
ncbi:hypothetical protein E4U37_001378 [Claviceps purpurea]|nr:hypothetical protein E4U37_001378 [Claviceps purpurea]